LRSATAIEVPEAEKPGKVPRLVDLPYGLGQPFPGLLGLAQARPRPRTCHGARLIAAGADLINTDKLDELQRFLRDSSEVGPGR
jgi:hypothetical protein